MHAVTLPIREHASYNSTVLSHLDSNLPKLGNVSRWLLQAVDNID